MGPPLPASLLDLEAVPDRRVRHDPTACKSPLTVIKDGVAVFLRRRGTCRRSCRLPHGLFSSGTSRSL